MQFSASQEFTLFTCIMPLQHYSVRCQNWRLPKWSELDRWVKLLSGSQNGCSHDQLERKQSLIWPFFIFLLWVCMLGWMRQSSAAGLKESESEHSVCDSWERRIRALHPRQRILTRALVLHLNILQSWKYHQTNLQNCCGWRIRDKHRP